MNNVSNQLISLASRESNSLEKALPSGVGTVSNQLISLASREGITIDTILMTYPDGVSNQLISLASREREQKRLCAERRREKFPIN